MVNKRREKKNCALVLEAGLLCRSVCPEEPSLPDFLISPCAPFSTRRKLRRGWPTAKRRRQPLARRRGCSPCVIYRAHGENIRRVLFMAHGEIKDNKRHRPELTAAGSTSLCAAGPGHTAKGRGLPCAYRVTHGEVLVGARWQHTSPCARARGTRQRLVSSPCAADWHTANCGHFAVCHGFGTRQSDQKQPVFFIFSRLKYPLKPYIIDHIS